MSILHRWPARTYVGRQLRKDTIAAHASATPSVRRALTEEVARIAWAHKLAPSTLNLIPTDEVPEVHVIEVVPKGDDVSDAVLSAIDEAIPFPLLIEVHHANGVRLVASGSPAGRHHGVRLHSSDWLAAGAREALPPALDLEALYLTVLTPLLPSRPRPGERPSALTTRLAELGRLEREAGTLTRRMRAERQLNRALELRRSLMTVQSTIETLR